MDSHRKFVAFGPADSLRRMAPGLITDQKPRYTYKYSNVSADPEIDIVLFEEYQRQLNSSTSLTCIFEMSNRSLKIELMPTGGRMGFRGSSVSSDKTLMELVTDFIADFSKRYGLTLQEIEVAPIDSEQD